MIFSTKFAGEPDPPGFVSAPPRKTRVERFSGRFAMGCRLSPAASALKRRSSRTGALRGGCSGWLVSRTSIHLDSVHRTLPRLGNVRRDV
jgi:hypothetical protein